MAEDDLDLDDEDEDDDKDEDDDDDDDEEEGRPSKGGGRTKLYVFIGGAALLVLVAGGAATAYFTGMLGSMFASEDGAGGDGGDVATGPGHKLDLPVITLKLRAQGRRRAPTIELRVSLELGRAEEEDITHIDSVKTRIIEDFQNYVSGLSLDDIKGAAGPYLLREALLERIGPIAERVPVRDVLITSMLVDYR